MILTIQVEMAKDVFMVTGDQMIDWFESIIDVGSGFILAVLIQLFIFPLFDLYPSILDSMGIALIFTFVSVTRSALWRRFFRRRKYEK